MSKKHTGNPKITKIQESLNSANSQEYRFYLVVILFAASFVLHTILNILIKENVTVVIDEGLYTNIARSLAWDGKLAFRGQPVNYPYLLYPFLLVPVYKLNALWGSDIYRAVQIFNTLLITSSVFPVYLFAKDFTRSSRKSFFAALIVALMPDMIMGGYEMTECLIWPLSFWMVFFCYRFYSTGELKYGLFTALFTGLLFASKPGAVAAGAVLLTAYFIKSVIQNRENIKNSLLSLLLLIISVGVVYGIFLLLFGTSDSLLGLYTKQTEEWKSQDFLVAIEAVFLLIFLFIFSCGGIYGIFPVVTLREYENTKRHFILSFILGILVVIIGTSFFVVPYKWTGQLGKLPLHLRYCSMFIPIMYIFSVDRNLESKRHRCLMIALGVLSVLSVFPGARAGFVSKTGIVDSITLAAFIHNSMLDGQITGWLLTVFAVICFVLLIYRISVISKQSDKKTGKENRQQQQKKLCSIGTTCFLLFILFNSICAHIGANVYIDSTVSADAREVNQKIAGKNCLGITQRYYDDIHSYWLESRLTTPMQQVTADQMFIRMEETSGVYSPFTPVEQSPNVNNHETPDTDTFILGMTIADHLELSNSVTEERTENGHFSIVHIQPSECWVDTMMYGLDDNALYPNVQGYIHIFDDNRNIDGYVTVEFTASGPGTFKVNGEKIELDRSTKTFEVTIPYKKLIPVNAENGTIQILSYSTRKK